MKSASVLQRTFDPSILSPSVSPIKPIKTPMSHIKLFRTELDSVASPIQEEKMESFVQDTPVYRGQQTVAAKKSQEMITDVAANGVQTQRVKALAAALPVIDEKSMQPSPLKSQQEYQTTFRTEIFTSDGSHRPAQPQINIVEFDTT